MCPQVDEVARNLESAQLAMEVAARCGEHVPERASSAVSHHLG